MLSAFRILTTHFSSPGPAPNGSDSTRSGAVELRRAMGQSHESPLSALWNLQSSGIPFHPDPNNASNFSLYISSSPYFVTPFVT